MSDQRPSKCSHCANPATIHLTQIVDGEVKKQDLCQQCPNAAKINEAGAIDIVGVSKFKNKPIAHGMRAIGKGLACPKCGFTKQSFEEYGRLGCSICYDVFATELEPVFRKAHPGLEHKGKRPAKHARTVSPEEIEALKRKLQERVESEDYEQAALLRDQIWELEGRVS